MRRREKTIVEENLEDMETEEHQDSNAETCKALEGCPQRVVGAIAARRPVKTALHQAVLDNRLHQVRLLVAKHKVNVDSQDMYGRTPLMLASFLDNEEYGYKMVKIFLKTGASVNIKDNMNRSVLIYACLKGREKIVERILREDTFDINEPDNDGNGALNHAAMAGNPAITNMILDVMVRFGLSIDDRNKLGYTALLQACKYGHWASAYLLLTKGDASPTLRDNEVFLNAFDWANSFTHNFGHQRSKSMPALRSTGLQMAYCRETTMYERNITPVCRHRRPGDIYLPFIPGLQVTTDAAANQPIKGLELIINGKDARVEFLKELERHSSKKEHGKQHRPTSNTSMYSATSYPQTPMLLAQTKKSQTMMFPDMKTLFKFYSDQYGLPRAARPPPNIAISSSSGGMDLLHTPMHMRKRMSAMVN